MHNKKRPIPLSIAAGATLALGLCASFAALADNDDLITTASTAASTAYTVGKNLDNDFVQARRFADSQAVALQRESATGGGENLDSLATLLGETDPQAFGRWMQSHYGKLYPADMPAHSNLADRIVAMR